MIFKEKIMLSNCDSVRCLSEIEIKKRLLVALTFSDGVILSPNIVIDNLGFDRVLSMRNVHKYLNEEGVGKFVIRGFNVSSFNSMYDYFDSRDDSYIVSSVAGSPKKKDLKGRELKNYLERLRKTDQSLRLLLPEYEDVILPGFNLLVQQVGLSRRIPDSGFYTQGISGVGY